MNRFDKLGLAEFKVATKWYGYMHLGRNWWMWTKFGTAQYTFDLTVSENDVRLAGPGTAVNNGFGGKMVWTHPRLWSWGWATSKGEIFSAITDGWRVKRIPKDAKECGIGKCGVEVRYKVTVAAGGITVTQAAPTINIGGKAAIGGNQGAPGVEGNVGIAIPIGPAQTKTGAGSTFTATVKYRLCSNGAGSFTFDPLDWDPQDTKVLKDRKGKTLIKFYWYQSGSL